MKKLRVIIVAMPGTWQRILQQNIESHPSVDQVEVVHGSLSAIQLAEERHPELLVIDSSIPTDEVVALLKNFKSVNPNTQSIVLTDSSRQGRRITLAGADYTLPTFNFAARIGEILNTMMADFSGIVDSRGKVSNRSTDSKPGLDLE